MDAIFFCPHHPEYSEGEPCGCRKPEAGLVDQAVREFGIEPAESYMIGDKTSDIQTGINAGMQTILVRTGKAGKDGLFRVSADWIEDDLLGAITRILHEETIASKKKVAD